MPDTELDPRSLTRSWGLNSERQYACPQRAYVVLPNSKAGIKPNKEHSHIAQSRYPILKMEEQDFRRKGYLNRDLINQKKKLCWWNRGRKNAPD